MSSQNDYLYNKRIENELVRIRNIIAPHGPLPISRSHFYKLVADGVIAKPIRVSKRISAWRRDYVDTLISHFEEASK